MHNTFGGIESSPQTNYFIPYKLTSLWLRVVSFLFMCNIIPLYIELHTEYDYFTVQTIREFCMKNVLATTLWSFFGCIIVDILFCRTSNVFGLSSWAQSILYLSHLTESTKATGAMHSLESLVIWTIFIHNTNFLLSYL